MIRGLYTSAGAMQSQLVRMDVAANNLANVNTSGYKKDATVFRSFWDVLVSRVNNSMITPASVPDERVALGVIGAGMIVQEVLPVQRPGPSKQTGNPYDLAIVGDGFFVVQTPAGERYTRQGSFVRDENGILKTLDGYPVMGEKGPIEVRGSSFEVDGQGHVMVDGQEVDRLRVVDFANPVRLRKLGDSLFEATVESGQPLAAASWRIEQGFLEASNVNPVMEMVEVINSVRWYEASQKAVQAQDETLGRLVNDVPRL